MKKNIQNIVDIIIDIIEENIVYEDPNFYTAFPSIINIDQNKNLISFRSAPKINKKYSHLHSLSKVMLVLTNKNKTEKIFEIAEKDEAAKQDPQLFRVNDNTIIAYYFRYTFHPLDEKNFFKDYTFIEYNNTIALLSGIGICISYDNGNTFSKPNIIKLDNNMKHFAVRGNMCKIGEDIFMPIYAYKKNINKKDCKYQSYIIYTKDLINWKIKNFLCETEFRKINNQKKKIEYVEPSIINYNDQIISFLRTHVNNEYGLTSISYLENNNFSKPIFTNIKGYPLNILVLKNNKILLTYGYRLKPYGIRAILLDSIEDIFDIEKINYKADNEELIIDSSMKSSDCGYPSCIENDDGSISCVYYGHKDKNKIRKIYMKRFILKI